MRVWGCEGEKVNGVCMCVCGCACACVCANIHVHIYANGLSGSVYGLHLFTSLYVMICNMNYINIIIRLVTLYDYLHIWNMA